MTTPNPLPLYAGPDEDGDLIQQGDALTFLAARWWHQERRSPWTDERRVTGLSSDALAAYGAGLRKRPSGRLPMDASDLGACERTYLMAPDDVRERMLPVLVEYRAHVADWQAQRQARAAAVHGDAA